MIVVINFIKKEVFSWQNLIDVQFVFICVGNKFVCCYDFIVGCIFLELLVNFVIWVENLFCDSVVRKMQCCDVSLFNKRVVSFVFF